MSNVSWPGRCAFSFSSTRSIPWRMYSATGTRVFSCKALRRSFCSGVMYTVVDIFFRAMARRCMTIYRTSTTPIYLMWGPFPHILTAMFAYRASCHRLCLVVVATAAAALGCAGKTDNAVAGPGTEGGMAIDQTRCDPRGKQVVVTDTNQDKKPDVTKLYETREVLGQKTQVLACKQVDLNYDGRVDIVYH